MLIINFITDISETIRLYNNYNYVIAIFTKNI